MSKNIDKVKIQIPGTMYYLQLAEDRGRWVLSLLLRGDVEQEVIVPVFSKNGINKAANELLNNSRLVIDKYPLRNVCDQLFTQAETNLPTHQTPSAVEEVRDTEELEEILQKIDLLENTLENTQEEMKEDIDTLNERMTALENERVSRLEGEIAKDPTKGSEEMIGKVIDRIDHIEEIIARPKQDERIPGILTAIEAIEKKIGQLEGMAVTTSTSPSAPIAQTASTEQIDLDVDSVDILNLKDELGRLSRAFDLINQRLTDIENKIKIIAPSSTGTEGEQ